MNRLWEPGERIDKWLILDRHMGAWGVVYVMRQLDYDKELSRPAVLIGKTLRPEWSSDLQYVKHFEQEAYAWLSLGVHKHIVRLFFVDRYFDQVFAFGEYIPETLLPNTMRGWIDAHIIELESALRFGVQICRALAHSRSRGVMIHRDLKPENVMITSDGLAKVTDWGLSHMQAPQFEGLSSTGKVPYRPDPIAPTRNTGAYGTPGYMAPELSNAEDSPTPQSDMFSLGVMLIEMISGKRPDANQRTSDLMSLFAPLSPQCQSAMAEVISDCLSSSPEARPDSPQFVEEVLADALAELVGVPIEEPLFEDSETVSDLGQRAYALLMLGRLDEAMKVQAVLTRRVQAKGDPGTKGDQPPVVLMDYKEHGWKFIIPSELVE
ncbi:MAG: serine/threonine-protein kinase, partial [Pyrinomonadaceae bacterium]